MQVFKFDFNSKIKISKGPLLKNETSLLYLEFEKVK